MLRDQESDQHNSSEYEEQMNEIQRVIELTRQLQRTQRVNITPEPQPITTAKADQHEAR